MRRPSALALLLLAGALPACTVGPNYAPPTINTPPGWASPMEGGADAQPADLAQWWTVLNDPVLDRLVRRALDANLDLQAAEQRVLQARAARGIVAGDELPRVDADGSYTRSRGSERTGGPVIDEPSSGVNTWRAGLAASWELDVFGRVRRNVEAADAQLDAAVERRRDLMVILAADVAQTYADLRAFQRRLVIARENVGIQQETLSLSRARFDAGLSSELDVARATALLQTTLASIPPLEAGVRSAIYRLAVLIAEPPEALVNELTPDAPIPAIPSGIRVGLPSDLLLRRPDLRAAERDLAAQTAQIGVATADLYPRFSLLGGFGFSANDAGRLFDLNSRFWSIGPALTWNVFDNGRIRSNIRLQEARTQELLVQFQQAALRAMAEVDSALVAYAKGQQRLTALAQAVEANQRAVDLANQLYSRGLTDFFSVLDTQRQLFLSQDLFAESQLDNASNLITLYRALGGGWSDQSPPQPAPADPAEPAIEQSNPSGS